MSFSHVNETDEVKYISINNNNKNNNKSHENQTVSIFFELNIALENVH